MPWLVLVLSLLVQDPPTFTSAVSLVRVDAEVRANNAPVNDLRRESFRITDNGRPRPIVYFAHEEQPLDVILLFDTSASMRPVVARVAEAAHAVLADLRPGDRVEVMAFDQTIDVVLGFTEDFAAAGNSIGERVLARPFRCCTPIQEALAEAARQFAGEPVGVRRRAVAIVTDDEGTRNYPGTLRKLWDADAVVLGVIVREKRRYNGHIGSPSSYRYMGMRDIAVRTGGDSIDNSDAAEGVRETIHRLRLRYSLNYQMPHALLGEQRRVQVELTPEAAAHTPGPSCPHEPATSRLYSRARLTAVRQPSMRRSRSASLICGSNLRSTRQKLSTSSVPAHTPSAIPAR